MATKLTAADLIPGKTFYSTSSTDSYAINRVDKQIIQGGKKPTSRIIYVMDLYRDGVLFKKESFKTTLESINELLRLAWTMSPNK